MPFGFAIYTNRYSDKNRPYQYKLKFAVHEDCLTTEEAIDNLRMICLYDDANMRARANHLTGKI